MEKNLFQFIWKYSKKDQIRLLIFTLVTFPVLFMTLELPKRIINDAINGSDQGYSIFGMSFSQVQFLLVLCVGFLIAVVANGLLKMRINTMKGVLAERLLRRFRYQLLTRIHRFPRPYFRSTSQGELVSMVTSEAEPMGGLMGDALAQPVFQTGYMLTILTFLFAQSFWFGLASIAVIPLQAWLIPKLQRQINLLNKDRIHEVRKLAADIGESASGASDIRINGGMRYRMALFSKRLGNLYDIRFDIYQKKFFMKFLNNFINQLTPLFFYSVGGYLAIQGEITVGALVAALAAYKDLSSPWKELLAYYNEIQDMSLRWQVVMDKFTPKTLANDKLFEDTNNDIQSLKGDINIKNATVKDESGRIVLEDISLSIPQGARVAVKSGNEAASLAFADLLTREVLPQRGTVTIAGHELNSLHQTTLANRIGYAHSKPHLLEGTLGENLLLPFKSEPVALEADTELQAHIELFQDKAANSGNSTDAYDAEWVDPSLAGLQELDAIREWWFQLVEAMGIDDFMVRRALDARLKIDRHPELSKAVIRLRPEIEARLVEAGLDNVVHRFHPDRFNPVSPLGSNLLYALPSRVLTQLSLSQEGNFVRILRDEGIAGELAQLGSELIEGLTATFGQDGIDHPLFRRLNMETGLYQRLGAIVVKRREVGDVGLPPEDYALMLTVPFAFSAEQFGPAFTDDFKELVLKIRKNNAAHMLQELDGLFEPIDPERYYPVMSLLGNAIFGRVSSMAGAREKMVEDIVVDVLSEHGLRRLAAQSIYDLETSRGGDNLPTVFRERVAFSRAGIKKPDVLILGNALASHDSDARDLMRERISTLLPETTKIFIEKDIKRPDMYDLYVEIVEGRIDQSEEQAKPKDAKARQDLDRKLDVIAGTELFAELNSRQQRLLAFSAQWYKAAAGQTVFTTGEDADAAYLCFEGLAGLYWLDEENDSTQRLITEVSPGRLIGDLSVLQNTPRLFDLKAIEDCVFLRLGKTELVSVIEHDATVAANLLRTVAGHLAGAATKSQQMQSYARERGVDFLEFKYEGTDNEA